MARKFNDSIDLAFNELQNVVVQNLSGDPGVGLADGRLWYDTATDSFRGRANGAFITLAAAGALDAEQVHDIVGAMIDGNTETGITVTYDDTLGKLDFAVATLDSEGVQDIVGAMTVGGTESGITVAYDDTNARLDFTVTDSPLLGGQNSAYHLARANHSGTQTAATISDLATAILARSQHTGTQLASTISDFTTAATEVAQDVAGTIVGAGGIVVTYDDAGTGLTTLTLTNNEALQDVVGPFFASGTGSSGITVTYDDAGGDVNYVVTDSPLLGGQNSAYHLARANHSGTQLFSTVTTTNTDRLLGRDTAAGGPVEEISLAADHEFTGAAGIRLAAWSGGDITKTAGATSATVTNSAITNAKLANMAANSIKGNNTGGSAVALDLTAAQVKTLLAIANTDVSGLGSLATVSNLTGNVTSVGATTTIAASVVTNAMHSNMNAHTIKGNNTAGAAAPIDLTLAQVKTELAYNGTEIVFTPAGNIAAANVSAAISELESDMTALITATVEARTWKDPVDAATTGALPTVVYGGTTTLTGSVNGALPAQDGVTLAVGDDLLVKDQASSFQDGVYTVTDAGSAGTVFILTRRGDSNTSTKLRDATMVIEGGTTQGGDIYTQTVSTLANLTAATQTWAKTGNTNTVYSADGVTLELVGSAFQIKATAAGAGLTGGGGAALDVAAGTGLEISSDTVRIAAAAAGNGLTGGAGSALAVGVGTGLVVTADAVAVDRTTGVGRVPLVYAVTLTGGATSEVVTHNLGTRDVVPLIYLVGGTFAEEDFTVEHTSTTTITIRSSITIAAATYRVVVLG